MTRARVTLAIAFGALALTACGGGGDDNGGSNNCDPTAPGCTTNVPPASGNTAPTAKANGPYSSVVGGSVSFSAAGSFDKEDQPQTLKYEWDFGDGTTASGAQATHTYTTAKSYTASLKVTDTKNATGNDQAPVTISPAPTPPAGTQTGTLSIVLTDAPFPFDSVASANMYVVRVDARFAEPTAAELSAPVNGNPTTGWVTVATPTPANQLIDLLTLQGGVTKQLGAKTDMPVGSYRGFRIVLDVAQSNLMLRSGTKPTIAWGGTGQVAYNITPAATVTLAASGVANVLVDFDLGRSFAMVGASPSTGFQAAPSLRTIASGQNGIVLGRVVLDNGSVVEGASLELLPAGTDGSDTDRSKILATTGTNTQGGFQLSNVTPGAYALRITLPSLRGSASQTFAVTASAPAQALATSRSFEVAPLR